MRHGPKVTWGAEYLVAYLFLNAPLVSRPSFIISPLLSTSQLEAFVGPQVCHEVMLAQCCQHHQYHYMAIKHLVYSLGILSPYHMLNCLYGSAIMCVFKMAKTRRGWMLGASFRVRDYY